jgi:hypothetical protein
VIAIPPWSNAQQQKFDKNRVKDFAINTENSRKHSADTLDRSNRRTYTNLISRKGDTFLEQRIASNVS